MPSHASSLASALPPMSDIDVHFPKVASFSPVPKQRGAFAILSSDGTIVKDKDVKWRQLIVFGSSLSAFPSRMKKVNLCGELPERVQPEEPTPKINNGSKRSAIIKFKNLPYKAKPREYAENPCRDETSFNAWIKQLGFTTGEVRWDPTEKQMLEGRRIGSMFFESYEEGEQFVKLMDTELVYDLPDWKGKDFRPQFFLHDIPYHPLNSFSSCNVSPHLAWTNQRVEREKAKCTSFASLLAEYRSRGKDAEAKRLTEVAKNAKLAAISLHEKHRSEATPSPTDVKTIFLPPSAAAPDATHPCTEKDNSDGGKFTEVVSHRRKLCVNSLEALAKKEILEEQLKVEEDDMTEAYKYADYDSAMSVVDNVDIRRLVGNKYAFHFYDRWQ